MKLYKCSWIYHSHLRFRLTLRNIHRWFAARSSFANQRQEFIHESTPAETQAVLIRTVPIWKNTGETDGNKKTPLHFWSEVFEVINTIWQRPKLLTSKSLSKRLWIVFKKSLSTKLSTILLITFFFLFHIFMLSATNKNSVVGAPRRKKVCYREYIHSPLGDGDMFSAYKGELIDWFSSLNLCFNSTNNL